MKEVGEKEKEREGLGEACTFACTRNWLKQPVLRRFPQMFSVIGDNISSLFYVTRAERFYLQVEQIKTFNTSTI